MGQELYLYLFIVIGRPERIGKPCRTSALTGLRNLLFETFQVSKIVIFEPKKCIGRALGIICPGNVIQKQMNDGFGVSFLKTK